MLTRPAQHASLAAAFLLAALLAPPTARAAQGQPPQPSLPIFGDKVEMVVVDLLALDRRGVPVHGLTREDFTVQEGGVTQTIASFEEVGLEESPESEGGQQRFVVSNQLEKVRPERAFLVIYDDLHLTALGARLAQAEFGKLIDGLLPGDVVSVLSTSRKTWWTARLPEGREELAAFARGVSGLKPTDLTTGRMSDWEALQISRARNPAVLGMVARRYYESGLIPELTPPRGDRRYYGDLDVSPGLPLIRAKAQQLSDEAAQRASAALEVMKRGVAALAMQRGRKAVLLVSEGFLHDSTRTELPELVTAARQANAVLYFFDARGRSGSNPPGHDAENWRALEERDFAATAASFSHDAEGAESAALDTGGRVVKGTDELAEAMLQAVRESRSYYLLGYLPSNTRRDGKFREIKVTVARPGLDLRARKGYYAPKGTNGQEPAPGGSVDPRVRAALDSPFDSDKIPLRMASYVFGADASGKASVVLAVDVDLRSVAFQARADRQVAALDSFVLVSPLEAGGPQVVEKRIDLSLPADLHARLLGAGLPVLRSFELPSGRYQSRLLVRDPRGGAVGTVRHTFEVPPAGTFRISTPILSDELAPGAQGAQVPVPLARRSFRSGSRVFYAFEVYGARIDGHGGREVAISYLVRRKDGALFAESPARSVAADAAGPLSHQLILSLNGAQPGEYELLLTVEDKADGSRIERRDGFAVDPS